MFYLLLTWLLIAGGAWYYYNNTQETIATLTQNNTQLQSSVESLKLEAEKAKEEQVKQEEANKRLSSRLLLAEKDSDKLTKVLREHDLTKLAIAKPGLIEIRINNAVKKSNEELIELTSN